MDNHPEKEGLLIVQLNIIKIWNIKITKFDLTRMGKYVIKKVDHIGIAVRSLEEMLPFYTDILQLELLGIEEVKCQQVKVAFIKAGETKLELLEPTSEESAIAKYIAKRGQGIHHIALEVGSIRRTNSGVENK